MPKALQENYISILKFVIPLLIVGGLTNQLVQPLFSPRISEITTEPLYIQTSELDYYLISKVEYTVEVPLFPWVIGTKRIILKLPYGKYSFTNPIELNTNFKEVNPYITVELFTNESTPSFIKDHEIPITIETHGFQNKKLQAIFYVREKWDELQLVEGGNLAFSGNYWWNYKTISPALECNVKHSRREFVGYGIFDFPKNRSFKFEYQNFRNDCDLKIRGFKWKIPSEETVCIGENKMNVLGYSGREERYISFDLNPGEVVTVLYVNEERNPETYGYIKRFDYHYQGDAECFYAWNIFQNLRSSS